MAATTTSTRRVPLAPPSPKIINLPTRRRNTTRRKKTRSTVNKQPIPAMEMHSYKGKLESLFGAERDFTRAPLVERRERVVAEDDGCGGGELEEEKWRFQAEILRAECNFLRMERKVALKKLERNRVRMQTALKSALQNLHSGRKKLYEGKKMELVLEEEMKELAEKLEELQSSYNASQDSQLRKCSNFDRKAARLQWRLEKLGGLSDNQSNKEVIHLRPEINEDCKTQIKSTDVETFKMKMEGLSKGVLDRMEKEFGSILSTTGNSSASTSKRIDFPDHNSFSNRFSNHVKEPSNNKCSGRCKVLVRKIVEQVRAETEQWSQMQEMLGQLRQEMEELQTSKDFWESQALASANEIQSLHSSVEEWKGKANELHKVVSSVKAELEKLKKDEPKEKTMISLSKQIEKETKKDVKPLSLGKQLAREKRILICRLKENRQSNNSEARKGYNLVRSPFKDTGNLSSSSSSVVKQNSNAIFPLHCPESAKMEDGT